MTRDREVQRLEVAIRHNEELVRAMSAGPWSHGQVERLQRECRKLRAERRALTRRLMKTR